MEGSMGEEKAKSGQGGMFSDKSGNQLPLAMQYDYTNFYFGAGDDAFAMLEPFDEWWKDSKPSGYYLYGLPMQGAPTTRVDIRNTKTNEIHTGLLNFASYNYLGLSYRPEVKEAVIEAVGRYGNGASGSPILSGSLEVHHELSDRLAEFKGKEAVLLFPTGYSVNVGVIAGLMRSGDLIVADQYAHASLVDGMILSKANSRFFRHNKVDDLERKLKRYEGKKLVLIEGVYSMDGDVAVVPDIVEVCQRYGARILIDEAHSTFIYGKNGRGVAEHFGYDDEIDMHVGTFSKSLGGQGGFVAGSQKLINYLRGFSRSRTFSCGLSPVVAAGKIGRAHV
jgi:glycine C-acetyltransferase